MPCVSANSATISSSVISPFAATRASIQPVTPASLPCPPPFPCRRGASDPVSRRNFTRSFTNFGETRKCRAASRCPWPSSTYATTRVRSSIGCGLPISDPHICINSRESHHHQSGNPESERPRNALVPRNTSCRPVLWHESLARNVAADARPFIHPLPFSGHPKYHHSCTGPSGRSQRRHLSAIMAG